VGLATRPILRTVKSTDHLPLFQVEPATSPTSYTRSISFVSSCKWETHVPVPTSQYTSENLTNPVDTICKSSLIYSSLLKHGLHNPTSRSRSHG